MNYCKVQVGCLLIVIYVTINYFRECILYGNIPSISLNLVCIFFSITSLMVGVLVFYKTQDKFIFHI